MSSALTAKMLLGISQSSTVSEAAAKGDSLGWERMSDEQTEEWRAHFLAYHGGSLESIGWRRGEKEDDGLLSFWIAKGPNAHKACSYSTSDPAGLLDELMEHLGPPDSLDKHQLGTIAYWKQGS